MELPKKTDLFFITTLLLSCVATLLVQNRFGLLIILVFTLIYIFISIYHNASFLEKLVYVLVVYLNTTAFIFGFHEHVEWFDNIAHIMTTLAVTVFLSPYIFSTILVNRNFSVFIEILIFTIFGVFIGVLWEFWEFYANIYVFEELGPTYHDTITDLIYDTLGALVGSIIVLTQPVKR